MMYNGCLCGNCDHTIDDHVYFKDHERGGRRQSVYQTGRSLLIIAALIILMIPLFAQYLNTIAFLAVITFVLFVPVFVGIKSWVRYKFFNVHE